MPGAEQSIPKSVTVSLLASGFPFQIAVAQVIRHSKGWNIHASEYPWLGPKEEDRFLDIIATNNQFVVTVECKKTRQDTLTFLRPLGGESATGHIADFRCLSYSHFDITTRVFDVVCETWALWPVSPSCEFCIVGTTKSERLLERDASLVIRATKALIQSIPEMQRLSKQVSFPVLFLPVIVTTAQLFTARYKPSEVSLETGEFNATPEEIDEAPWVRFSKAFTAGKRRDFAHRGVFVVSAKHFDEFLNRLELAPNQLSDKMPVNFQRSSV